MLLTRKATGEGATSSSRAMVDGLARGLTRAIPTMDRRKFLRRSGMGLGVGITASQLTLVRKAHAADPAAPAAAGGAKVEVKRTVCTHCSVGCAIDAVMPTPRPMPERRRNLRRSIVGMARDKPRARPSTKARGDGVAPSPVDLRVKSIEPPIGKAYEWKSSGWAPVRAGPWRSTV